MVSTTVFKGSPNGQIIQSSIPREPLKNSQVLVKIHKAGFCGTDLHYTKQDMVLGHEGAGVVEELGPGVRFLKVGDRVGFGWVHDSCGKCSNCISGDNCHCLTTTHCFGVSELDQGGFSTHAIWKENFLYPVPDSMSLSTAAPLMCAGIAVWAPLVRYGLKTTDRVGVVGIGALGHLAIQFASKMGCDVVAFSGSEDKREEALALGAKEFVVTKGDEPIDLKGPKINHLLVTGSRLPSWGKYIEIMSHFGTIYPQTVQSGDMSFPFLQWFTKDLAFRAVTGASRLEYQQMLEFAIRHDVKPMIEKFPFSLEGVRGAEKAMREGTVRYKVVLDVRDEA
ncbi:hypothetical protein NHQ30_001690 [Ciborinia camelliae]|nr:hypothetical protein NHQ30_001690 [Ciborinia camelliae]